MTKIMIKSGILIIFILSIISLASATPISNSWHTNIQVKDGAGVIQTGTFLMAFNISDASDCSSVLYSNISTLATDGDGIISFYMPNIALDYSERYYLCVYKDGVLYSNGEIVPVPYSFWSNKSDYWDNLNTTNSTQLENQGGTLHIIESWLTTRITDIWNTLWNGTGASLLGAVNGVWATNYTAPATGTVQNITAYINVGGSHGSQVGKHFKFAIYDSSRNLLGQTNEWTISLLDTYPDWYTLSMVTPQAITSGQVYFLGVWGESIPSGSLSSYGTSNTSFTTILNSSTYGANFPNPLGIGSTLHYHQSIYANYSTTTPTCWNYNPSNNLTTIPSGCRYDCVGTRCPI